MKQIMEQYGDTCLSAITTVVAACIYFTSLKAGGMFSEIVKNYLLSISG